MINKQKNVIMLSTRSVMYVCVHVCVCTPACFAISVEDISPGTGTRVAAHRVDTIKLAGRRAFPALIHIYKRRNFLSMKNCKYM